MGRAALWGQDGRDGEHLTTPAVVPSRLPCARAPPTHFRGERVPTSCRASFGGRACPQARTAQGPLGPAFRDSPGSLATRVHPLVPFCSACHSTLTKYIL